MTPLFRKLLGMNWFVVVVTATLLTFGVYSISAATSYLTGENITSKWYDQILWIGIGTTIYFSASLIDYRWIKWAALPAYIVTLILLLSTNTILSGAKSWMTVAGFTFQPSQLAIVSGILLLAVIFGELPKRFSLLKHSLLKILMAAPTVGLPCFIILNETDFGSAMAWCVVFMTSLVIGKVLLRYVIVIIELGLIIVPIFYYFGLKDYQKERIETWINMLYENPVDEQGAAWVPKHNMIAIGSAGYLGKMHQDNSITYSKVTVPTNQPGINNDTLSLVTEMGFVPSNVAINDFIFVTIAERHGFRGTAILITLYSIMLLLLLFICYSAKDMTGRMIVGGFIGLLFYHVFMNIGMCVLLVPITGIPLPFISYGGTFLLMMMFMLGLCQSVWIHRTADN
ncbi:MAG: FtsW/RodA/SpoVE family cell cycle protein [Verrucomicrobiota bacterium]|nr:FtsW/RodA/SpoVE family cell cycle protein [Verrucomicrobiota bacterium]